MTAADTIDHEYVTAGDVSSVFPERPADCHKGDFGYVALVGGSLEYSGAIRLAALANAAVRSGAGVATVCAPRSICPVIAGSILEATLMPLSDRDGRLVFNEEEFRPLIDRYACVAFGMGIGNTPETAAALRFMLEAYEGTLIVDADGLNAMAGMDREIIRNTKARLLLTPHMGEFSKLSGMSVSEAKRDPVSAAGQLAAELGAVVLLKGSTTVVAGPPAGGMQRVLLTDRGCPGMASGGSGDVLSGILAAVCAGRDDLVLAAAAGAYINGAAGELAQSRRSAVTMTAADTAACVAETIEEILRA